MGLHAIWLNISLSLGLLLSVNQGFSQITIEDSIVTTKNIVAYSLDRSGNLFLTLEGGTITKYSSELDSLLSYYPTRVGDFRLLEAWHGFQVLAFNSKFQDFILMDRFLSRESRYNLGKTGMFYVDLATLSGDQNLWLLEENGLRLMKYDFKAGEIILDISLDNWLDMTDHDFSFIREYQNLLFLVDKNSGIYIFDNLANFLRKVALEDIDYISMSEESMFYLSTENLLELNLYSNISREIRLGNEVATGVLVYKNIGYLVSAKRVKRFRFPEN